MNTHSPLVDRRSFDDLVQQLEKLLQQETDWRSPEGRTNMDRGGALVRLTAQLAETVLQRVNQAPDKNFVAFLDMIGAGLLAPKAARVPLTFGLSEGATDEPVVRAGTQASALLSAGSAQPVIFETESDLAATRTLLQRVYSLVPDGPVYADCTDIATGIESGLFPVFEPSAASEDIYHYLALGARRLVGGPPVEYYIVNFTVDGGSWGNLLSSTAWVYKVGTDEERLNAGIPTANGQIYTIELAPSGSPSLYAMPSLPNLIDGAPAGWLVGVPLVSDGTLKSCTFSAVTYELHVDTTADPAIPPQAVSNETPADLTKPFYPFREEPQVGDCFYLDLGRLMPIVEQGSGESILDIYGTLRITLHVVLGTPGVAGKDGVTLSWQYWDANSRLWTAFGESSAPPTPDQNETPSSFVDNTIAFTTPVAGAHTVDFDCPATPGVTRVMGENGHWIRIVIVSGNYGVPASYESVDGTYEYVGSTLNPPMIDSLTVTVKNFDPEGTLPTPPKNKPDAVEIADSLHSIDVTQKIEDGDIVSVYEPLPSQQPALYLGFERSGDNIGFANRQVSIYFDVPPTLFEENDGETDAPALSFRAQNRSYRSVIGPEISSSDVRWEYCPGGETWKLLGGQDGTFGFTRAGILSFIGPPDFQRSEWFSEKAFWIRAVLESGVSLAILSRIALNTVAALNAQAVRDEVLGSSSGQPGQTFKTSRFPVLDGQKIQVREKEIPSRQIAELIEKENGPGSIIPVDPTGECWVQWREVPDFYASGPSSRHYLFDHQTGAVTFGDGKTGMIPPAGRNSVRASQYMFGGGEAGNLAAGAITQLRTSIPGVTSVINVVASDGGRRGESLKQALERAPSMLRNRNRAVAPEDYVDLAYQASRNLARVHCEASTDAENAGQVTLVVVPDSTAKRPAPTNELLAEITDYMLRYMPAAVSPNKFAVIGPRWVPVNVSTDVVPVSPAAAADVQNAVIAALDAFLNPVTGGPQGKGWPFNEVPLSAQLMAVVAQVSGVDHVRNLDMRAHGHNMGMFMIFAGAHEVTIWSGAGDGSDAERADTGARLRK